MDKINLVDIEESMLKKMYLEFKNNPKRKVREKAGTIYYRAKGYSEREIRMMVGVATPTITRHVKKFNEMGINYVYTTKYTGLVSKLFPFEDEIVEMFKANPPQTIDDGRDMLDKKFNIKISKSALRKFLKKKTSNT